jgi:hypothetical protein
MNIKSFIAIASLGLATAAATGCVTARPARNGVFNENLYLRKAFLVRDTPGPDGKPLQDPGWMLEATITDTSSPNPLGGSPFNLYPGFHSYFGLVRFRVDQDKLDVVDMRELSANQSAGRIPQVLNAWSATNVDLKYRVNLDGEQTNFYEENQELPWQQRQWVKVNLAKNDLSDIAVLGIGMPDLMNHCVDVTESSATIVNDSIVVDEKNNYVQWKVQVTVPIVTDLPECVQAYGDRGNLAGFLNKPNVTMNLLYSLKRADPNPSYQPLIIAEKESIRHKYGPLTYIGVARDEDSTQLAATEYVIRFDPAKDKPVFWYFDKGFPENYKAFFNGPGGIKERTNKLLETAGAKLRFDFRDYNDDVADDPLTDSEKDRGGRTFGDIRYSWLRWMSDKDMQDSFAGVTEPFLDPRTGETLSNIIVFNDFAIKDYYVQRINAFLQYLNPKAAEDVNSATPWPDPGPCYDGDTTPIIDTSYSDVVGKSTLFQKMQVYLQRDPSKFGNQGPSDFIPTFEKDITTDAAKDFFNAYYAILPYEVFRDPDSNPFVIREGGAGVYGPGNIWKILQDEAEFQQRAADIDRGRDPYNTHLDGAAGVQEVANFLNRWKALTINHRDWDLKKDKVHPMVHMDAPDAFSFEQIIARDARHCIGGVWETKEQWVQNLIDTYWSQVFWHEFGHGVGLDHNFMASVDRPNFPVYQDGHGRDHYGLYANSVMEYNATPDRIFWHADWAPYDRGAISWIYANSGSNKNMPSACTGLRMDGTPCPISGQFDQNTPWKDPAGFDANGKEIQFLFCNGDHLRYSPFCRAGDMGTTPSEIIANAITSYEWQYNWRNFRVYRKFWDNAAYANGPAGFIVDMRRFLSTWTFDWGASELADTFRRIGVKNPNPNQPDLQYFTQLTNKFNEDISTANQLVGAFHKAIIQQGSGERPFATLYDKYYGDVTQQGIILDKLFAMQGWVALWPTDNYDVNQAGGYIASYAAIGEQSYQTLAEDVVSSMVGGQYNVYPYFRPLAVVQFAQDTHSPEFTSFADRPEVRDWIGGQVFTRLQDFLDYFRDLAVQNNFQGDGCGGGFANCTFDPRPISDTHNQFVGPDKRVWIWSFVPDRNQYVAVRQDRNIASYIIVRNYNDDVVTQLDDGAFPGGAYGVELPVKYFLDAFTYYR